MKTAGIEAMNVFGGSAFLSVSKLARLRKLDNARFENLLMQEKAVALPFEDPVTFAVNAATPLVEQLAPEVRDRIELVITCSESGIDFGKSLSTYVHDQLKLSRNCRLFETKQACYAMTAGFQMALNFVLSGVSPGAKALVVGTDISRFAFAEGGDALSQDWSYSEPSAGAGAVALLVGEQPTVFRSDVGANGYYGYEVMDTCRPSPDSEAGNAELSLLSYLDCCEQTFEEYRRRVADVDYRRSFDALVFHTPFGGMVKGAHRTMMRKVAKATPRDIEPDFHQRVAPGLRYCQRVGNIMGGTIFMALASAIDAAETETTRRVGCFSYGSGCCSEFFSGTTGPRARNVQRQFAIDRQLDERYELSMDEYHDLLRGAGAPAFGTRNAKIADSPFADARKSKSGQPRLVLQGITEFHREYAWIS